MTQIRILGAAAILASALASPAMAQQVDLQSRLLRAILSKRQLPEQGTGKSLHRQLPASGLSRSSLSDQAYRDRTLAATATTAGTINSGFWPGDVAAGVVGGAVGTAAAIATAPIGGDEYARRNGFVCIPGTWFRGEDGRQHICQ